MDSTTSTIRTLIDEAKSACSKKGVVATQELLELFKHLQKALTKYRVSPCPGPSKLFRVISLENAATLSSIFSTNNILTNMGELEEWQSKYKPSKQARPVLIGHFFVTTLFTYEFDAIHCPDNFAVQARFRRHHKAFFALFDLLRSRSRLFEALPTQPTPYARQQTLPNVSISTGLQDWVLGFQHETTALSERVDGWVKEMDGVEFGMVHSNFLKLPWGTRLWDQREK
ncbi:MAG: hypothetical protein L6R40_002556 [Gallowayella cf. fulva]|nr:MAG: hypothetical protein L6R40_002556 [Xanthomendoza cf. fulva]